SRGSGLAAPAPTSTSTQAPPAAKVQTFSGTGQKALGTTVVPTDSTISWNCPSCGNSLFQINNASGDSGSVSTNAVDQTHGVDPIAAGTDHTVVLNTDASGPWTVDVAGSSRHSRISG